MRTVMAFILRCFVDDAFPDRLRGTLQAVDGEEKLVFHDAEGLLAVLRRAPRSLPPAARSRDDPLPEDLQPNARSSRNEPLSEDKETLK